MTKIRDEAEIFRAWRKRLGFNQVEAGDALGRTDRSIQMYESSGDIPLAVRQAAAGIELEKALEELIDACSDKLPREHYRALSEAIGKGEDALSGAAMLLDKAPRD